MAGHCARIAGRVRQRSVTFQHHGVAQSREMKALQRIMLAISVIHLRVEQKSVAVDHLAVCVIGT